MKINFLFRLFFSLSIASVLVLTSCSDDEGEPLGTMGVAFETTATGISSDETSTQVKISLSRPATVESEVMIGITENGVTYGVDYSTSLKEDGSDWTVTIPQGSDSAVFTVSRLVDFIPSGYSVSFELLSLSGETDYEIAGNTATSVSFEAITSPGGSMTSAVGGPTQPNIAYVDLSLFSQTAIKRASWDLGFYTGSDNRVILNSSLYMAAAPLEKTDITTVTAADSAGMSYLVGVGTFNPESEKYIDSPDKNLSGTAFGAISSTDADNPVYIVNLGAGPGKEDPEPGKVDTSSDPRGWMKVRVLMSGSSYVVQYAEIDATAYEEVTIARDPAVEFVFFSLKEEATVPSPEKAKWDIRFTVSPQIIPGFGPYGYSDYIEINNLHATAIAIDTEADEAAKAYDDFKLEDVAGLDLSAAANVFGSSWRDVFSVSVNSSVYFVLKDVDGNYYKIQPLSLIDQSGVRGHTSFKYELL